VLVQLRNLWTYPSAGVNSFSAHLRRGLCRIRTYARADELNEVRPLLSTPRLVFLLSTLPKCVDPITSLWAAALSRPTRPTLSLLRQVLTTEDCTKGRRGWVGDNIRLGLGRDGTPILGCCFMKRTRGRRTRDRAEACGQGHICSDVV